MFLVNYVSQFQLTEDIEKSKINEGKYYFVGKKGENTSMEFVFNNNLGLIEWYRIKGECSTCPKNQGTMNVDVAQNYTQIAGIYVPTETTAKIYTSTGVVKSILVLKDVKINQAIDDSLFVVK